ncbi:glycosyltransferase family protein [Deferribacterales bacterium Es71-Z0220]|uniref:glycosyltransferase family protein n=1 Tax=Deferrivibrio essentukiensis TaxID=2880922 RepID=UPI001F6111D3|nr:glycosyltransferase family protein [Deferrivibrio essentukiensis]MCB4203539.1 glycosyltransferase family protein [Deferrivibrio essentukiensis]
MKVGAIIQARTSSTRLPKKILKSLPFDSDITVLQQVIRRVLKAQSLDEVIIATTTDSEDEEIVKISDKENVRWFKGSKDDVLSRYYLSAKENNLDAIVRVTSDCPCIDWNIIDLAVEKHLNENADYTSNTIKRAFPHGLDVEVISFDALEKAYFEAKEIFEREHVCPYIHTTNKDKFNISSIEAPQYLTAPDIRITLDVEEDYALLCAVFDYLYYENEYFEALDIVKLFGQKPWLKLINKKVVQKKIFTNLSDEVSEAVKVLKLQDLYNSANFLENIVAKE